MQQILVVEDEPTVSDVVARYLRREGYGVSTAGDGEEGLRLALQHRPDLVVLDLMLPGLDGLEVCRRLRAERQTPVVMITAKSEEHDVVLGLGLGADDYIRKPFSPAELVARVKAVLRRGRLEPAGADLSFGSLRIDEAGRAAWLDERQLELTAREFDLLWHLARHAGQVFSREQLLTSVWGYDYPGDTSTVTVHMRRLREKLEPDPGRPEYLKTVWGIGYKFEAH
ncbi:MAG TPA: response regulator transcription factor [Chloroflexota bacterium]|nr:response regulator transcription factor [Chloroflexota bacterium]